MVTPTLLIPPDIPENKPILHTLCTFMDSLAQTLELKILYCLSSVREADAIYSVTATSTRKPILVILTVEAMMKDTVGENIPSTEYLGIDFNLGKARSSRSSSFCLQL